MIIFEIGRGHQYSFFLNFHPLLCSIPLFPTGKKHFAVELMRSAFEAVFLTGV